MRFVSMTLAFIAILQPAIAQAQTNSAGPKPTVAVYVASPAQSSAIASAMTDSIIQKLLDSGRFTVIDRQHMQQVLGEQGMATSGQVLPSTEAQLGRKLGANYVFTGKIVTFSSTVENRTNIGTAFLLGQNAKQYDVRLDLTSGLEVIDVTSGAILQSLDDHQSDTSPVYGTTTGTSLDASGYASQEYQKMVEAAAAAYVSKVDMTKFVASAPPQALDGHIMDVTSDRQIIISLGRDSGVTVGTVLGAYTVKRLTNPDTGKVISTYIKRGSIEITQVEKDYSVGKSVGNGPVTKIMVVRTGE